MASRGCILRIAVVSRKACFGLIFGKISLTLSNFTAPTAPLIPCGKLIVKLRYFLTLYELMNFKQSDDFVTSVAKVPRREKVSPKQAACRP